MDYVIDYYNSSVKKEIDGWPKGINAENPCQRIKSCQKTAKGD
jgi:hypothetical protein